MKLSIFFICMQLILILTPCLSFSSNKIVYLISPPRSLSTAFLRMIQARGDFDAMNEPSLDVFHHLRQGGPNSQFFSKDSYKTFEELDQAIVKKAEQTNIFVKEISFSVEKFFLNNNDLLKRNNTHFIILVRNPHHALISFYNKCGGWIKRDTFTTETCYASLYAIFQHLKKHAVNKPAIVLSESLYSTPSVTLPNICNFLAIPYLATAGSWQALDTTFTGTSWHHFANTPHRANKWHSDALQSTQFHTPTQYKIDDKGQPSFEEITNATHREICTTIYHKNLEYYNLLLAEGPIV